jgi:UDP-glucose 4-epimerase
MGADRVLVSGASGLLGAAVCRVLAQRGADPIGLYGRADVDLDRPDAEQRLESYGPVSAIIHCAARLPDTTAGDEAAAAAANLKMDDAIARFCARHGTRLVFLSGASVYGSRMDSGYVDETCQTSPVGPYADAKLISEGRFLSQGAAACLRVTSPYGPALRRGVVRQFIDAAERGSVTVWGSGTREQDFVHVDDVARACALSLEHSVTGVFNICANSPTSMMDLASVVADSAPRAVVVRRDGTDPREGQRARYSHERAARVLGWKPQISLREGVSSMMAGI